MEATEARSAFWRIPSTDPDIIQRGRILQALLLFFLLIATLYAAQINITATASRLAVQLMILVFVPGITIAAILLMRRLKMNHASHTLIAALTGLLLLFFWQSEAPLLIAYLFLVPILAAAILLSTTAVIIYALAAFVPIIISLVMEFGFSPTTTIFSLTIFSVTIFGMLMAAHLRLTLIRVRHFSDKLRLKSTELQNRAQQMELVADIGGKTGSSLELTTLLQESVRQISQRFAYDRVTIYLKAGNKQELRLGGSSNGGAPVPALPIDSTSLPGLAAEQERAQIARRSGHGTQTADRKWTETAAQLAIPLQARGELIGVLDLHSQDPLAFQTDEVAILKILANQLAINIDNKHLFTETESRLDEVRLLYNFNTMLTTTLHEEAIYERSARAFATHLQGARCQIFRWTADKSGVITAVDYTPNPDSSHSPASPLTLTLADHPGTRYVLDAQAPQLRHQADPAIDPLAKQFLDQNGFVAFMELPVVYGEDTTGLIRLFRNEEQPDFKAPDLQIAQAMSNQIASALANAQLTADAQEQVSQLQTLNRISHLLSAVPDLHGVYEGARKEILRIIPANGFSISLLSDDGTYLHWEYGYEHGAEVDLTAVPPLPISTGFSGHVARTRELFYVNKKMGTKAEQLKSIIVGVDNPIWLGMPMIVTNKLIGVLAVENDRDFSAADIELLKTVVSSIAIAINNLLSLEKVQNSLTQLQANLRSSTDLYETSRRLSGAKTMEEVFHILMQYAEKLDFIDAAMLITESETEPLDVRIQSVWQRQAAPHADKTAHFRREPFIPTVQNPFPVPNIVKNLQFEERFCDRTHAFAHKLSYQGAMLLPLATEDQWYGTWVLLQHTPAAFTPLQYQPLISLTDQASTILANDNFLRRSTALFEIGQALNQAITREDAVQVAEFAVAEYIGVHRSRFIIYDQQKGYGEWLSERQIRPAHSRIQYHMTGDPIFEKLNETRQPVILSIDDPYLETETLNQYLLPYQCGACLLIPSASQQEVMGFLAIDSHRGTRPFTNHNIIFAQTVVDQLTTQIENIKLLDEALERAQELIMLNQIQANISYFLDLDALARAVYDQLGRLLDTSFFLFALYKPAESLLQPVLHLIDGRPLDTPPYPVMPDDVLDNFLHGRTYRTTQASDPLMQTVASTWPTQAAAALWMPLLQENKPIGLITIQSGNPTAYKESDIQLLRSVSTQTSLAMVNADLFAQIQAQNEKLLQVDQLKTQFLANMSHELRTPLNSIIGFSRIILKGIDGPITEKQAEDLTAIYNNGQHLLQMINEILDMAKIEAGKMTLVFKEIEIAESILDVRDTIRGLLVEDNVRLVWDVPDNLPRIEADPLRLRQILLNLLSNAAKFTSQGTVSLSIRPVAGDKIHFAIADTGIGIAEKDFDLLFTAFEQIKDRRAHIVGGTGLGLPITRWLVKMHQGEITVESEVTVGTTFHVILPCKHDFAAETVIPLSTTMRNWQK
jgi:signal transduction histidine kinase